MAKRYAISVHDMNRKKQCDLFDSTNPVEGEALDIEITKERNGWKEIHFSVPYFLSSGEKNIRCKYLDNELLVRLVEGNTIDWYYIVTPKDVHNGLDTNIDVTCEHVSGMLKTRNLFGYFDDANGIGKCQELCEKALKGTGWVLKSCDTFLESDGVTEKVRSYSCDEKTGAWDMIQGICELFMGYPIFDGDSQEVTIRSRLNHDGIMEITFGKNTENIERSRDTSALVTRLYVQGDYTDNGYVGIDDAKDNELHLNFICNFDHYRELGLFTEEHEAALNKYLNQKSTYAQNILQVTEQKLKSEREFGDTICTFPAIFYEMSGNAISKTYKINSPKDEDVELKKDDKVAAVQMSGDNCTSYEYVTFDSLSNIPQGTAWLVKFTTTLNGKLMTAENFTNTWDAKLKDLQEKQDKLEKDKVEKPDSKPLDDEISAGKKEIEEVKAKAEEYRKQARECMAKGISLVKNISLQDESIALYQKESDECEKEFAKAMGTMLRDGYWSSDQYIPGQEDALYSDALDISKEMAHPQYEWSVDITDLSYQEGWDEESFHVNQTLRIFDEVLGLKQYAYVEKHTINPRQEWKNTITISTDELGIASRSLANILTRITDMAQLLKDSAAIYKRASAIGDDGSLAAKFLEGMIDISKNKILSVGSNWYTDDNGNIVFVALDESSAMMLTGMGFMVANGKTESGEWNWRTFGTGDGFTADLITAGFLSADRIRANSITANHLAADVGQSLDLSSNESINLAVKNNMGDALKNIEIGGTNLVDNSNSQVVSADENSFWVAADQLEPSTQYTLSVKEVIQQAGQASCVTWEIMNLDNGTVFSTPRGTLEFTRGKQVVHFTTPPDACNQALILYAGEKGSTIGVVVMFNQVKLEVGTVATAWSPSPDDTNNSIQDLSSALQGLDEDMQEKAQEWFRQEGITELTGNYTSMEDFLTAVQQLLTVESNVQQNSDSLALQVNQLQLVNGRVEKIETLIQWGAEPDGTPYLDMSASNQSVRMRLTNTRLSFIQEGRELAYFSDNKLYVTQMEAVQQMSIGTPKNGYLDMITTPSGVGMKWHTVTVPKPDNYAGINLIPNTGFADGTTGWKVERATVSIEVEDGVKVLKMTSSSDTSEWHNTYCTGECASDVGTEFTASAWVRYDGDDYIMASIAIQYETSSASMTYAHRVNYYINKESGWTRISATKDISTTPTKMTIRIGIGDAYATGKSLLIYHPKLEAGNVATAWSAAPEDIFQ